MDIITQQAKLTPPPKIEINPPTVFGPTARGSSMNHVVILPSSTIKSEPGYPIPLDATFVTGGDFIKADPDGRHVRLEVQSLAKDNATGGFIRFNYTGTVSMGGAAGKVLRDDADAATTSF